MNKPDAIAVLKILATADGGCATCVGNLLDRFVEAFPEHRKLICKENIGDDYPFDDGEIFAQFSEKETKR